MENFSKDLITLLQYLLPGFISAWIFYALTTYPKPSQFERTIQALIFTIFVQALLNILKSTLLYFGQFYVISIWNETAEWFWLVACGVFLGLIFSYFANNDKAHKIFRWARITTKTSYPSEWFGAFQNNVTFIVLHLKDERRLYGWPLEWPSESNNGHFLLTEVSWLIDEDEKPITGVDNFLVAAKDVKWIEFMKKTWEDKNEQKSSKSTSTSAPSNT